MTIDLHQWVKEAFTAGAERDEIKKILLKAGWQKDEIQNALDQFLDAPFPIPVPRRKPYLSAREAFLYLLLFLTLAVSAISFGTLLFQFINRAYPDLITHPDYASSRYFYEHTASVIRRSTSALVVAFPVFLWVSWVLEKTFRQDPEKRKSKIRTWITYITLFITAGVILGDLITVVYNFLGGELTIRFALKFLTVGGISGAIFGYYLWDLRKEEKEA